jgi:hypothetical protein
MEAGALEIDTKPNSGRIFNTASGTSSSLSSLPLSARSFIWPALNAVLVLYIIKLLQIVSHRHADLFFLYYQPFLPMIAMLWFWAIAVFYFEQRSIRYDICFSSEDQRHLLPSHSLFGISNILGTLVLSSSVLFLFQCSTGNLSAAAFQPPLIYLAMLLLLIFPGVILFPDNRRFFSTTLWRVFTPIRGVTWADFLLADILTSLAKALSDTERAVCHLMTGESVMEVLNPGSPALQLCGDASWIIPVGLALPYVFRLIQCLRVYKDTGSKPQVWNAIKYSTAFPVIALSAVRYHTTQETWRSTWKPMWLLAAAMNSGFSYFWDIERDWEIGFFSRIGKGGGSSSSRHMGGGGGITLPQPQLQSLLLFPKGFYLYLMLSNFILRQAWTYKLSPHLRNNHLIVFCIVILEVFRRFQWLFVRIEVELRKIQAVRPEVGQLVPAAGGGGQSLGHAHRSDSDIDESFGLK